MKKNINLNYFLAALTVLTTVIFVDIAAEPGDLCIKISNKSSTKTLPYDIFPASKLYDQSKLQSLSEITADAALFRYTLQPGKSHLILVKNTTSKPIFPVIYDQDKKLTYPIARYLEPLEAQGTTTDLYINDQRNDTKNITIKARLSANAKGKCHLVEMGRSEDEVGGFYFIDKEKDGISYKKPKGITTINNK